MLYFWFGFAKPVLLVCARLVFILDSTLGLVFFWLMFSLICDIGPYKKIKKKKLRGLYFLFWFRYFHLSFEFGRVAWWLISVSMLFRFQLWLLVSVLTFGFSFWFRLQLTVLVLVFDFSFNSWFQLQFLV